MEFSVRFVSLKGNRKGEVKTFTLLSKLGGIPNPGVNERNASSPWKRLVLNSVKREENRVPSDSNGDIPDSLHLWVGDEHTFELSSPSTSERWSIGSRPKGQGLGLGKSKSDPGSPPRNPAESVALRVRQTKARNARNPCCHATRGGANHMAAGVGFALEAKAGGNAPDRL